MSKTSIFLVALVCLNAAFAQTACQTMFAGLTCRTTSEDPTQVSAASVTSARNWLCSAYPQYCTGIVSGGTYASCNSVEQLSYAMNAYYTNFQSQGASACSFGGIGVLVAKAATTAATSATTAAAATPTTAATATPTTASGSTLASTAQCQAMFAQASCRTASEDPTQVSTSGVTSSRNWLCNVYPQFCLAITGTGAYTTCNSVEQLSYAMSLYYNQYKSQGASACNFGGIAQINAAATTAGSATTAATSATTATTGGAATPATTATSCQTMFAGLTCRTTSEDPTQLSASSLSGARSWLCSSYPAMCTQINTGGTYASCNAAEQLSYAMNQYYNTYSSQGASACNFGGVGVLVTSSSSGSGSGVVVSPTPAPALFSKVGLAWPINQFNDGTNPPFGPWATGMVSWIYTWSYDPTPLTIPSNLEWVPMLHSQTDASNFISRIQSGFYDNAKNMLLFNEPDLNYPPYAYGLDVNTAISITLQVFQAIQARGKTWRVGTPAMSYNMNWLQQYLAGVSAQCPTCKFSFVPVHMYTLDENAFKANVQNYYNTFGLPVWVTEFADTDFNTRTYQMTLANVQQFMNDTTYWLNAQSWVERYSWFGVMRAVDIQDKANMAMNSDGSRNALGDQYVLRGGSLN